MCVTVNYDIAIVTRGQLLRRWRANFVTVADVDSYTTDLDVDARRQVRHSWRIGVAEHCPYGGNEAQLVQNLRPANITSM